MIALLKITVIQFLLKMEKVLHLKKLRTTLIQKKSIIKDVRTKEGDGYILGEKVKKNQDDIVYTFNGKYTTCDVETPHFSIRVKKIKTHSRQKIITGPAI